MKKPLPVREYKMSRTRKIVFSAILYLFPILFLLILEAGLRVADYGENFDLFITNPDTSYSDYKIVNPEIGAKYFHKLEYTSPRTDIFKKVKDPNTFRVFVMGSSTVFGFPYESNLMFPRILQSELEAKFPGKKIEVINTAITAINSYTLLDFTDDILAEKPDAVLIYAGHNEFYGAMGAASNEGLGRKRGIIMLNMKLMNFRLYQLLRNSIDKIRAGKNQTNQEMRQTTLMARIVGNNNIEYGSREYWMGIEQYRANVSSILEKASKKKVPVFISTLVSNVEGIRPLSSVNNDPTDSADIIYSHAKTAAETGDYGEAGRLYTLARDLDRIRFRASSDINSTVEELSKKYNATLVPMVKEFEAHSPNGLVGNNLLTEHVHPNISGYFLMANTFYNALVNSGIIGEKSDSISYADLVVFKSFYGYTELDSLLGYHRVENLRSHWPFRDESKNYIDYRKIYKPVNALDSLAFSVILTKEGSFVNTHLALAEKYRASKDLTNACREYKAIAQIAPNTPELLKKAADCFLSASDLPMAMYYFEKSIELKPSYYAYFRAGEIYMMKADYGSAASYFTKAFKIADPEYNMNILSKLYMCYIYQNKKQEADQVMGVILKFNPKFRIEVPEKSFAFESFVPVQIADQINEIRNLVQEKKNKEAIRILEQALEINQSPIAYKMLGMLYFDEKDLANSSKNLSKAYPWFNFDPKFLTFALQIFLAENNLSDAHKYLDQLKVVDPGNPNLPLFSKFIKGTN
ncbi:MAG: hypothetical protein H6539_03100 [Bacteroidales bacterium]|nr:hypothetical protein [Bacteroidales bacterium]